MLMLCKDCLEEQKYNGWLNYETWCVNLHLTNDEHLYNSVLELLKENKNKEDYERVQALKEYVCNSLADLADSYLPSSSVRLLLMDLYLSALSEVDWLEILHSFEEKKPHKILDKRES